jgi:LysR family transcriptional regulator, glycine cleavage system transcriptional activator
MVQNEQLILTQLGRYLASVQKAFCRIAEATERLKPQGVATVLSVGVSARFDLGRLRPDRFRAAHPTIGLRIMEPAGLDELAEGKVDVLINSTPNHHAGYRCEPLEDTSRVSCYLIYPGGTAGCPEIETLRAWLNDADTEGPVAARRARLSR